VSQLIADLEGAVGLRLFDRTTRKVALSSAGKEFLAPAQTALRHLRLTESAAADLRNRSAGIVRVAAPLVVASVILPPELKAYAELQPKVNVRIRDAAVDALVEMVASGDADLALGPDRVTDDAVTRLPLLPSPWVLWCSPEHRHGGGQPGGDAGAGLRRGAGQADEPGDAPRHRARGGTAAPPRGAVAVPGGRGPTPTAPAGRAPRRPRTPSSAR
jgi:DNA-binding transcriptional LysR family regulator